jgi:hypothetical protein
MYVKRNQDGKILSVSRVEDAGFEFLADDAGFEFLADDAAEVKEFLRDLQTPPQKSLAQSDLEMVRVLEDLVGLLIERSVIRFTDLPIAAQKKLLSRQELRNQHQGMNLLDDGEDFAGL